jgi:hypothetical protein
MELVIVALVLFSPVLVFLGRIVFRADGITFEDLLRRTDLAAPRGAGGGLGSLARGAPAAAFEELTRRHDR